MPTEFGTAHSAPAAAPVRELQAGMRSLRDARARTDELLGCLRPGALLQRPIPERHRLIFYLGHLEAFDWNLLAPEMRLQPFRPDFDRLFAFGIDPVDGRLPDEPDSAWPAEEEVYLYVAKVRALLDARLAEWGAPHAASGEPLLDVAVEHRLMHAETLACLLHELAWDWKHAPPHAPPVSGRAPDPFSISIPAGSIVLGRADARAGFGWDNEFGDLDVEVPAFDMDAHDVTNGRFLDFVTAGGYRDRHLWSAEDWRWLRATGREQPQHWRRTRDGWSWRGPWAEIELPEAWPVYVSHAEASAYARWLGRRLPTEAEYHRAAYGTLDGSRRERPWGAEPPDATRGNFDFRSWEPAPVGSHPRGTSAFGIADLVGNGWEWTSTEFAPLPGFRPFEFYPGYSRDFFDGHHFVLAGGSPRTAGRLLRRTFRNWFQPRFASLYATFRTVGP